MRRLLLGLASRAAAACGYDLTPRPTTWRPLQDVDRDPIFMEAFRACAPYSMVSIERMYALWGAVEYLSANRVAGSFVECGVWRGGSIMMMVKALQRFEAAERDLHLFDTFAGPTPHADVDRLSLDGRALSKQPVPPAGAGFSYASSYATLEEVRRNVGASGYPSERVSYHVGDVRETLARVPPSAIALLRLDTDRYDSTRAELEHLFPQLVRGGVLIVDDYGHVEGARRAVDEYFAAKNLPIFLQRIDYTGRLAIKPS